MVPKKATKKPTPTPAPTPVDKLADAMSPRLEAPSVSVKLEPSIAGAIDAWCEASGGISRQWVVNRLLRDGIDRLVPANEVEWIKP